MVEMDEKKAPVGAKMAPAADAEWRHVEIPVDRFDDGRRLDLLLSARYPVLSRSLWQARIRRREVTIDHRVVRPSRLVRENETIRFSYELRPEPTVNTDIVVLYEDEDLLIINKSPNLPVHASGSYRKHTLNELLIERYSTEAAPFVCRPVHRLDRETSGIIVYAKSSEAARTLTRHFMAGRVRKEYLVIVLGSFPEHLTCSGSIGPDAGSAIRKKQAYVENSVTGGNAAAPASPANRVDRVDPPPQYVACRTDFWLERKARIAELDVELSLLRARLYTGRMHQIRATLCSLGFPIAGDRLYGPDEGIYLRMIHDEETEEDRRRLVLPRSALHCSFMSFPHPTGGQVVEFTAPLPPDMQVAGL